MENGSEHRYWDELIPDALGLIFRNLSLQEILTVVPRVCKSWGRAVSGPYCWQEIDIDEWSKKHPPHHLDRLLRMLITRSCGSLRKLSVTGISNDTVFSFLTEHAGSLQELRMPRSEISDSIVEHIASRLSTITFLDVSFCNKISAQGLEAIGKHCKLLLGLCRNMELSFADQLQQDDEAHVIATTMPKLKHLEMAYHLLISTENVLEILSSCPELEFLNLTGCWDVNLDSNFLKENFPKLKVSGPRVMEYYDMNDWGDYCSEYSDASEYFAWEIFSGDMGDYDDDDDSYDEMWDDEQRLEELELRFYEGLEDAGLYGWPPSP